MHFSNGHAASLLRFSHLHYSHYISVKYAVLEFLELYVLYQQRRTRKLSVEMMGI